VRACVRVCAHVRMCVCMHAACTGINQDI